MIVGKVIKITNDVFDIEFGSNKDIPLIGDLLVIKKSNSYLLTNRILSPTVVRAILIYGDETSIGINDEIINTQKTFIVPVGKSINGKIFNVIGQNLNNKKDKYDYIPVNSIHASKQNQIDFHNSEILITGIKAIDFFTPIVKGSKIGVFGGAGVGKTVVIKELMFNTRKTLEKTEKKDLKFYFVGVGERIREGKELYDELVESRLIDDTTLFISQMNEPAGARVNILNVGITAAEYTRDYEKKDVLFFIDNIYRFLQAGRELSFSLGQKPSESGYQSTLVTDIAQVEERLVKNQKGSITSFQTVFLPMDDLTDPASVVILNHLDASLVLSREIAAEGLYPAIDLLLSSSSILQEKIVGSRHINLVSEVKKILQKYKELEDLIMILGIGELDRESRIIVKKSLQLRNYFTQDLFMVEHYTKRKGVFVKKEDLLLTVEKILNGDYLELNEMDFLYIDDYKTLDKKLQELKNAQKEEVEQENKNNKKTNKNKAKSVNSFWKKLSFKK